VGKGRKAKGERRGREESEICSYIGNNDKGKEYEQSV
jgi:hypothetical protein